MTTLIQTSSFIIASDVIFHHHFPQSNSDFHFISIPFVQSIEPIIVWMNHPTLSNTVNETCMTNITTENNIDLFTPVFKHFRRLPDSDCFIQAYSVTTHPTLFESIPLIASIDLDPSLGLQPICTWSLYACKFCPGLYFLPNPFTLDGQRQWIDRCVNIYARQDKTSVGENSQNENLARIRWATLGYHYDWTNKIYKEDDHTKMPDELAQLCQTIMQVISSHTDCSMMKAEAAIVNYYHINSTLCAHTDHSEYDALTKPLISLSFGNAAVFLIGGQTKSECQPSPLLLQSGDIILMTGSSRLCFHAVPRILADSCLSKKTAVCDDISWSYIRDKRININVRQVYA